MNWNQCEREQDDKDKLNWLKLKNLKLSWNVAKYILNMEIDSNVFKIEKCEPRIKSYKYSVFFTAISLV
jgi:hypothetical protein